jgi:plasmid stabilization system protein ParE
MEMKIFWTEESHRRLKDIFDYYYLEKLNIAVAQKIVNEVVEYAEILISQPNIGVVEDLLRKRKNNYRYIVCNNYKIIYWIDGNVIFIATVFDTRQNPRKIKRSLK